MDDLDQLAAVAHALKSRRILYRDIYDVGNPVVPVMRIYRGSFVALPSFPTKPTDPKKETDR